MSETIRCLRRPLLRLITSSIDRQYQFTGRRPLYTESTLDLDEYKNVRRNLQTLGKEQSDVFREAVMITLKNETNLVTIVDLRKMLHIVEKNEEDLRLLKAMVERYHQQNNDNDSYTFGPIIMRALHYLNEPHVALEAIKDPKFHSLYNQPTTSAILLDLLYEHGMFKEIRDVYDSLRERPVSKLVISVVAMACYKENSPASLQYALQMWKELCHQSTPMRRTIVTLTALALNQNKPGIALELLAYCHKFDSISVRSAKVMALCDLNEMDKALVDFKQALKHNSHYLADVAIKFTAAVKRLDIAPDEEIREVFDVLKIQRFIYAQTLDAYISNPIDVWKKQKPPQKNTYQLDRRKLPLGRDTSTTRVQLII
ncbi:pentatricopeptide repeat-containing protein 2, mitochondrial [Diachasma alloeum]|uniref:pentatricopeptide repeat-containing protein 2, mitochondrial n=1 Tax=Diachasma alloeum TaxID=454923 RepID=UPI000738230A|nr:pentatricopeptide repeat-containing protein 2, mitochondrial [Diachasma alloeum]XP_015109960.1 pentatricopeptide repeat-containing protein 2, mitochondrial [Diachasma alloeum]